MRSLSTSSFKADTANVALLSSNNDGIIVATPVDPTKLDLFVTTMMDGNTVNCRFPVLWAFVPNLCPGLSFSECGMLPLACVGGRRRASRSYYGTVIRKDKGERNYDNIIPTPKLMLGLMDRRNNHAPSVLACVSFSKILTWI